MWVKRNKEGKLVLNINTNLKEQYNTYMKFVDK